MNAELKMGWILLRQGFGGRVGRILPLMLAAVVLAGCSVGNVVPKTKVSGSIAGKPFSLETPKDNDLVGLQIDTETNGTVHLRIEKLTAATNPMVISNAAAGQAAIIGATAEGVAKGIAAAAAAAAAVPK